MKLLKTNYIFSALRHDTVNLHPSSQHHQMSTHKPFLHKSPHGSLSQNVPRPPPRPPTQQNEPQHLLLFNPWLYPFQARHRPSLPQPHCPTTHASTHYLVNHSGCATAGIYNCCSPSCPASPTTFFSSLRALIDHCHQAHPPPRTPSSPDVAHPHQSQNNPLLSLSLHDFFTGSHHQIPQTIGNMASPSLTWSTTMNLQTSAPHGDTGCWGTAMR
jgi:hypothetical protein